MRQADAEAAVHLGLGRRHKGRIGLVLGGVKLDLILLGQGIQEVEDGIAGVAIDGL